MLSLCIDIVLACLFAWYWISQSSASGAILQGQKGQHGSHAIALLQAIGDDDYFDHEQAGGGAGGVSADAHDQLMDGFEAVNRRLSIQFDFEGIKWSLPGKDGRVILSDVEGSFKPSKISAAMGPSGAGKTSLFRVLMGKVAMDEGSLRINGHVAELSSYKKMIGFVPQDDIMIRELTVRDNIMHSACVRLPGSWSSERIGRHVEAVIKVLGLEQVAGQPIGDENARGISGGQRKRVNIGIELASAPAALFLDEPTSGLDATAALDLMQTLRGIADLGITVVAILHQPRVEIFRAFDDLLLLEAGGRAAYVGPQKHVEEYFAGLGYTVPPAHNPADDLLDLVAGRTPANVSSQDTDGDRESPLGGADIHQRNGNGNGVVSNGRSGSSSHLPFLPNLFEERRSGKKLSQIWHEQGIAWLKKRESKEVQMNRSSSRGNVHRGLSVELSSHLLLQQQDSKQDGELGQSGGMGSLQGPNTSSTSAPGGPELLSHEEEMALVTKIATERGATFLAQVYYCAVRSIVQQVRTCDSFVLEIGVSCLAGGMMGASIQMLPEIFRGVLKPPYALISPSPLPTILPSVGLDIALATAIAAAPAAVKMFSEERAVYYREASSGHYPFAYFLGKLLVTIPRFCISALHFVSLFHCFARPTTSFSTMYGLVTLLYFCVYGLATLCSMVVRRENAALLGTIASLVAATMCGFGPSITQAKKWGTAWSLDLSFARWFNEAFFSVETSMYEEVFDVGVISDFWGYTLGRVTMDVMLMVCIGTIYQIVAFLLLVGLDRDKQK